MHLRSGFISKVLATTCSCNEGEKAASAFPPALAYKESPASSSTIHSAIPTDSGWFGGNTPSCKEIAAAEDPEAEQAGKIADYEDRFANPFVAAERGYVDDVITPSQTRAKLIRALVTLSTKRDSNPPKKHGSIPL